MKIVGVTGGIGSGKSVVCKVFRTWGAPVFDADGIARSAYHDPLIRIRVEALLGPGAYKLDAPDYAFISSKVFHDSSMLDDLQRIIHPWVAEAFRKWVSEQHAPYVIREAAILIESGAHRDCNEIVVVTAPLDLRMKWIRQRNGWSDEHILQRMSAQMTDEERLSYATRVVENNNKKLLTPELFAWHQEWIV